MLAPISLKLSSADITTPWMVRLAAKEVSVRHSNAIDVKNLLIFYCFKLIYLLGLGLYLSTWIIVQVLY